MQLSTEQLTQFQKNGFIILRNVLDIARCEAMLKVAKEHLEEKIEPIETEVGYDSRDKEYRTSVTDYTSNINNDEDYIIVRRLRQVYDRSPLFKAWMEDVELRPVLKQVLDDEVVLITAHHNSIMTKMPYYSRSTRWHQDGRYWQYSDNNLVSVWLALDSETSKNGVLEFIPSSHKMEFIPEQFDEKEYFSEDYHANKKILAQKVSTGLQKGDVVIFHSLLLHRANKNSTDTPKISFVYTVKGLKTEAVKGSRSANFQEKPLLNL